MKVGIKTTAKQLPKKVLNGVNGVGTSVKGIMKDHADSFSKRKFVQELGKRGINKDTVIGLVFITIAINSAVKMYKAFKGKINESEQTLRH